MRRVISHLFVGYHGRRLPIMMQPTRVGDSLSGTCSKWKADFHEEGSNMCNVISEYRQKTVGNIQKKS